MNKISMRINNRLRSAKLIGCPAELGNYTDSKEGEYLPSGITQMFSAPDFVPKGFNICILGASDTGRIYLAKAIGIKACTDYWVGYFHCEELLERFSSRKQLDYGLGNFYSQHEKEINEKYYIETFVDQKKFSFVFGAEEAERYLKDRGLELNRQIWYMP